MKKEGYFEEQARENLAAKQEVKAIAKRRADRAEKREMLRGTSPTFKKKVVVEDSE